MGFARFHAKFQHKHEQTDTSTKGDHKLEVLAKSHWWGFQLNITQQRLQHINILQPFLLPSSYVTFNFHKPSLYPFWKKR
jgi:hypothetical protein